MTSIMRREPGRFGDLFDWFGEELLPTPLLGPLAGRHLVRVEEYLEAGKYVLRVELPGIDPDKDVEITVSGGMLTVQAERREEKKEAHRSEFRYGSFRRSVTLPAGADEDDVQASYANGILEVRVGVKEPERAEVRRIPIARQG